MVRDQLKTMSTDALRARDKETRSYLSGVLAKFIEAEKEAGFSGWTEASEREIVAKYVKVLSSSLAELAGTPLAAAYAAELALLEPFLPRLLDAAATRALLEPLVGKVSGIGPVMGQIMKTHKGLVDPALVRQIAQEMGLV